MEFPGVMKKYHVEILGSTEKEVQFPGVIKGCNTILQNSKSKALICPEFSRVKVEFLGVIKKKSCCIFMSLGFSGWNLQGV